GMTDEQAKKELKKYAEKQIIGIIKAPSVGLEVGVLKGVLNRTLMLGAGTMRPDQVMGQGNYSVITHRTRRPGLLFSGVPKMKSGQLVYITDKETIYTYKVYDRFNVHQSETDVIYDEVSDKRGKPVLTLVTCFSLNDPEARVIVHAELVNSQPYTAEVFADLK
ncbi:MAG: class A sortase, partial [Clostridium sp.]|nr:class A sortase [Clostridium sp.]